jgi:hypothetical protein
MSEIEMLQGRIREKNARIEQLEAALYEITVECNVIKEIVRTTIAQSSPPKASD